MLLFAVKCHHLHKSRIQVLGRYVMKPIVYYLGTDYSSKIIIYRLHRKRHVPYRLEGGDAPWDAPRTIRLN